MTKASYLSYPKLESLLAAGANRPQVERSLSSYSYILLCRHTLQEGLRETLPEPSIGFVGEDTSHDSLTTIFIYLALNSFNENTGLNGPLKSFAEQEFSAFREWAEKNHGANYLRDLSKISEKLAELRPHVIRWIDNHSIYSPRRSWFIYAIQTPQNTQLRMDLRNWSVVDKPASLNHSQSQAAVTDPNCARWESMVNSSTNSSPSLASIPQHTHPTESPPHTSEKAEQSASGFAKLVLVWEIIFGCIGSLISALNNPHPSKWAFIIAVGLVTVVPLVIAHLASEGDRDKKVLDMADGFAAAGFWGSFFIIAVLR